MDNQDKSEQVKQAEKEILQKGTVYDELIRHKGWEYLQSYIEERIKVFANGAINGFNNWDEYQVERGKVLGLKGLLGEVTNAIEVMQDDRRSTDK